MHYCPGDQPKHPTLLPQVTVSYATGPIGPLSDRAYLASTGNVTWPAGFTGIQVYGPSLWQRRDRDRGSVTEIETERPGERWI